MGAENSKGPQRDREQALKDEANRVMERQKQLYEKQCTALEQALQKQQSAYLELKKKEEIQNEVQRLLKEREQETKKVAEQQNAYINPMPSAPSVHSYPPQHPLQSFQSQTLVQQACPSLQFSNLQTNPFNQGSTNFQPQPISHGPPLFSSQIPTRQHVQAAPKPLLPTPQSQSNIPPLMSQVVPSNVQNHLLNPQPGSSISSPSSNTNPFNYHNKNLTTRNERSTSPGWNSRESSNDRRNQNPYGAVKKDVKNAIKNIEKTKLYPNLEEGNQFDKRKSAVAVKNNSLGNIGNSGYLDKSNNNNNEAQGTLNSPTVISGKRSNSRPRRHPKNNKEEDNDDVTCSSCDSPFGLYIYQCSQGHSSCKDCKQKGLKCGECSGFIKDLRNFPLETYIAEIIRPCPNASEGCNRSHKVKEMEEHLKSCPFNEVFCPLRDFEDCFWKGKISEIRKHFTNDHPENYKEGVGEEFTIRDMSIGTSGTHSINLLTIGPYNFLAHLKLINDHIYFAVQLLSTQANALKWTYQFVMYNKSNPGQKYEYTDTCNAASINIKKIFGNWECAVMPIGYVKTFKNKQGIFNYKFFITKGSNNKVFDNRRAKNNFKGNNNNK